jgi:hypothetical protein
MKRQDSLCVRETGWSDKHPKIESQTETETQADARQDSLCGRETGWADKHPEIES